MARLPQYNNTIVSYDQISKDEALSVPGTGSQLAIAEIVLQNRSGGAIDIGWGYKQPDAMWKAGQIDDSETPDYVDDTTDAQDAGTNDFALFTTTNNDGFLVQSVKPFNLIGMTVGTGQAGSPTYEYTYYDGSSFSTLTTIAVPASYTAADHVIAFQAPHDWALGSTAAVGSDSDKYAIRIRATTAPSTAPIANLLWVGSWLGFQEGVADNGTLSIAADTEFVLPGGGGVFPYFGSANAANTVEMDWRPIGYIQS